MEKEYKCEFCSRSFASKYGLHSHIITAKYCIDKRSLEEQAIANERLRDTDNKSKIMTLLITQSTLEAKLRREEKRLKRICLYLAGMIKDDDKIKDILDELDIPW